MKKILISALTALALNAIAAPQLEKQNLSVLCGDAVVVVNALKTTYGETPIIKFNAENMQYGMFVNPAVKSWTYVAFKNNTACIIASGAGFEPID